MIDKFREKFVEEALDNVHDLEEALLLLENNKQNKEIIERIFRAMHSLKGGGAMFGFNDLSDFTHHLETVFDWVRNDKLEVSDHIISITLTAIDHIKHLLDVGDLTNDAEKIEQKVFISKVQSLISVIPTENSSKVERVIDEVINTDDGSKSYLITFEPDKDIMKNGTNLFYLIDDLNDLGNALSVPFFDPLPVFSELDPIGNYCRWQLILNTEVPVNEIKDVFIFVEDECKIDISEIVKGDITSNQYLIELVENARQSGNLIELQSLKSLVGSASSKAVEEPGLEKKKVLLKEHKISSIRVASNKVDELVTLVSELVTIQAQLNLYAEKSGEPNIMGLAENIQKLSRQLRDNAFEISLIPLQNELMRFQRLVRDLSKELGKEIDFIVEGGDIELDKNIIEHLTDPLLHIIRNSIDHGVEMPDDRIKQGKSPKGTIYFKAYYSGATVIIKVSDDGKGVDPVFIRRRAIERGLIDKNAELSDKDLFDLLFVSGFSTKDVVSDVSGRGVGMDVVKKKIGEIRGEVMLDSEVGMGTTTTLELPLTLSIIDGLLLKVAYNNYVVPISSIEKIHELNKGKISKTLNNIITIDDHQYPVIDLRDIFEEEGTFLGDEQLILVKYENKTMGLIVDQVIGEYQTVVKPLGRYLKTHQTVSGASILGDGSIAFVLDTNRLIHYNSFKRIKTK
ncbi:MAG: chemotaxis protein CheA [Marinilabiliaceae bacterium]|nr:chemotaxis protein CheA [Marinilabiliaceae bacterium]